MEENAEHHHKLLPHLFRTEYSKIVAVLCKSFGLKHIEIAEDIASDTFLKASEHWSIHGAPENPHGWLYTVARNITKDYFRHISVFETKVKEAIKPEKSETENDFEFSKQNISDSQLAMIFAVCNPANSKESQICLALQILCGFSIEEIANAFLAKRETIKKRLQRARNRLRNSNFKIKALKETEIEERLNTVLKTLYLLFNEGYFSKTSDQIIRKDLCAETLRLTLILTQNPLTRTPQTNALIALMCYHSSRLEARTDDEGGIVLFSDQDKSLWDQSLIEKGHEYLINACTGSPNRRTKYHLEAGIAYWHTIPADGNKWQHILNLYNQLLVIEYSPITALNRSFAFAKVYGNENAICEAEKLDLSQSPFYHGLLGYLYTDLDNEKAIEHYKKAIVLSESETVRRTLTRKIERLNGGKNSHSHWR